MTSSDRSSFFRAAQFHLRQAKPWQTFVKVADQIRRESRVYDLPNLLYECRRNATCDNISKDIMPSDANPNLIPQKSLGDCTDHYL